MDEATALAREIESLGLERHVYELDQFGFTVVDASATGARPLAERAFERILEIHEQRNGVRPDVETGSTHVDVFTPTLYCVLLEDIVFEELAMHPMALALATHLVGRHCVIGGTEVFMKGPATPAGTDPNLGARSSQLQLGLHSDNVAFPEPFTPYAHICNLTWLLSDYTKENGALALVPGSHKACRHPRQGEGVDDAVAVEAATGSLVVWHGNTWHGSYPRTVPGLRTGLAYAYTREYVVPHEPYYERFTKESLDRWPPRFATLMGQDTLRWDESGPDYTKLLQRPRRASLYW